MYITNHVSVRIFKCKTAGNATEIHRNITEKRNTKLPLSEKRLSNQNIKILEEK